MRPKTNNLGLKNTGDPIRAPLMWPNSLITTHKADFAYANEACLPILAVEIESGGPLNFYSDCDKWCPSVCASAALPRILKATENFMGGPIRLLNPVLGENALDFWDMLALLANSTGIKLAIPLPHDLEPASNQLDNWIKFAETISGHGHVFLIDLTVEHLIGTDELPLQGTDLPFYVAQELSVKQIDVGIVTAITYAQDETPRNGAEIQCYANLAADVPQLLSIVVEAALIEQMGEVVE